MEYLCHRLGWYDGERPVRQALPGPGSSSTAVPTVHDRDGEAGAAHQGLERGRVDRGNEPGSLSWVRFMLLLPFVWGFANPSERGPLR